MDDVDCFLGTNEDLLKVEVVRINGISVVVNYMDYIVYLDVCSYSCFDFCKVHSFINFLVQIFCDQTIYHHPFVALLVPLHIVGSNPFLVNFDYKGYCSEGIVKIDNLVGNIIHVFSYILVIVTNRVDSYLFIVVLTIKDINHQAKDDTFQVMVDFDEKSLTDPISIYNGEIAVFSYFHSYFMEDFYDVIHA